MKTIYILFDHGNCEEIILVDRASDGLPMAPYMDLKSVPIRSFSTMSREGVLIEKEEFVGVIEKFASLRNELSGVTKQADEFFDVDAPLDELVKGLERILDIANKTQFPIYVNTKTYEKIIKPFLLDLSWFIVKFEKTLEMVEDEEDQEEILDFFLDIYSKEKIVDLSYNVTSVISTCPWWDIFSKVLNEEQ